MNHYLYSLNKQLQYIKGQSSFYQKKFLNYNLNIKSLSDFQELPFTTKQEFLNDQMQYPPFGSNICVSNEQITRIHKTSGTSGNPLLLALTSEDIRHTVRAGAACFRLSGLKKNHIVIHCLNYNMWMGGYTDHQSLEEAGAAVIPFGVGHTKELIETILTIHPHAIHCTPSYLRKIEVVLFELFDLKPYDLKLKLGLFGAEAGLQNKSFRTEIENKWGITAMNANYGMSDVLSMFGAECYCQEGMHFMGNNLLYPELINSETLENIDIAEGVTGELVLTNLQKQAQPVVRYRSGDNISIISTNKCPCGRPGFKFEVIGRSDDMIVVKGVNVFLSSIENIITKHLEVLTGQYQVHISRSIPVERLLLVFEIKVEYLHNAENVKQNLCKDFTEKLFLKPEMQIVKQGDLPLTEGKTKRLFRIL
jgi:phenylacetate-CoA ligase